MTPDILRRKSELLNITQNWKAAGKTIGVVPTMGALHAGHLSLVERAKLMADHVIVTIFVNPKQFNSDEDFKNYPRTEEDDAQKLAPYSVDLVYVPSGDQMYPDGFATGVTVSGLTDMLCGAHRPGHFDGVATVVTKLFTQTSADFAFFGQKDFQQLQIVQRLATDLDLGVNVIGCPTIREEDGLAMSSRNLRLSPEARTAAPALHREMERVAGTLRAGAAMSTLQTEAEEQIKRAGFSEVEYLELRASDTLEPLPSASRACRLFAAAWLDGVRLIDNIPVVHS